MPIEDCHEVTLSFIELLAAYEVFYREVCLVLLHKHPIVDAVANEDGFPMFFILLDRQPFPVHVPHSLHVGTEMKSLCRHRIFLVCSLVEACYCLINRAREWFGDGQLVH